jgi:phage terminase Nu1 subunit (DNA packaging protein)
MASATDAARHIFMSERRFFELVNDGALTRQPVGAYDLDEIRREYVFHIRKIASGRGGAENGGLAAERTKLAREQTDAAAMRNAVTRGDLVSIEEVARQVESEYGVVRQRLLAIPGIVADSLVGRDRASIEAGLNEALAEALSELSTPGQVAADAAKSWGG